MPRPQAPTDVHDAVDVLEVAMSLVALLPLIVVVAVAERVPEFVWDHSKVLERLGVFLKAQRSMRWKVGIVQQHRPQAEVGQCLRVLFFP